MHAGAITHTHTHARAHARTRALTWVLEEEIYERMGTRCICIFTQDTMERGGSMAECLTRDMGVASSSLTGGNALCPRVRHLCPLVSTGSTPHN